jgi:4-diphosphocytidyl-2-C-methyl-D-erythritol kinase
MAGRSVELPAPAKLNLGLRILGRRQDGYHRIESLFLPLALGDAVRVEAATTDPPGVSLALEADDPQIPQGADNLAARAARAFLEATGLGARIRIHLRKRVPAGAGLGGGSSDAGAVLRALGQLFPDALPDATGLALDLGADVPYFLDPRPARVTGVGEKIEAVAAVPSLWVVLAHPPGRLLTADVYRAYDEAGALTPVSAASTMKLVSGLRTGPASLAALAGLLGNDLEPAAVRLCPEIARIEECMRRAGAPAVGMSGSGPTVYGLFPDEAAATHAESRFEAGVTARLCRTRTLASP